MSNKTLEAGSFDYEFLIEEVKGAYGSAVYTKEERILRIDLKSIQKEPGKSFEENVCNTITHEFMHLLVAHFEQEYIGYFRPMLLLDNPRVRNLLYGDYEMLTEDELEVKTLKWHVVELIKLLEEKDKQIASFEKQFIDYQDEVIKHIREFKQ